MTRIAPDWCLRTPSLGPGYSEEGNGTTACLRVALNRLLPARHRAASPRGM